MPKSARNNAHCSTACESCRAVSDSRASQLTRAQEEEMHHGRGPRGSTSCAASGLIRKFESDGRRTREGEIEALKADNAAEMVSPLFLCLFFLGHLTAKPVRECHPAMHPELPPDARPSRQEAAPQVNAFGPWEP
ncbi:hypothetical protein AURDEDRAFT_161787 [Auricularia subglabra TFB-10046 SS5]|nr:hypothetical protein AURDEDRAFT_161787 [Auricularia subglabra TFB-10046 SS5]